MDYSISMRQKTNQTQEGSMETKVIKITLSEAKKMKGLVGRIVFAKLSFNKEYKCIIDGRRTHFITKEE